MKYKIDQTRNSHIDYFLEDKVINTFELRNYQKVIS